MADAGALHAAARGIEAAWALWIIGWTLAGIGTKPVLRREGLASSLRHAIPLLAGLVLLLIRRDTWLGLQIAAAPAGDWLFHRFLPPGLGLLWLGAPLVLAGLLVTLWARLYLAGNWSGSVTLKREHRLIRSGPYRFVRHPIYTGLLIAMAGTACAIGEWRGVAAFVLVLIALRIKSRVEERVMVENFGPAYRRYQQEVRALVPFVF